MKKLIIKYTILLSAILYAFSLGGCSSDPGTTTETFTESEYGETSQPDTVTETVCERTENDMIAITIKEGRVSPKDATLTIVNYTNDDYTYGEYFSLEKKSGGNWESVDTIIQDYGFNDVGYILEKSQTAELYTDWAWLYGELAPGEYRIVKDFLYIRAPGDYDTFYFSCAFKI